MIFARLYIVRHGETDANRKGIIQGQLNTPLNAEGILQARQTAEILEKVPFDYAFTSDLERARKTAEAILVYHRDIPLRAQPALRERFMGNLEGKPVAQKATIGMHTAENTQAFTERCMNWWNDMLETVLGGQDNLSDLNADPGPRNSAASQEKHVAAHITEAKDNRPRWRNVLVVSHGGVIGFMVQLLLAQGALRCAESGMRVGRCYNASISVVDIERRDGTGVVVQYADVSHLGVGGESGIAQQPVVNPDEVAMAQAFNDEVVGSVGGGSGPVVQVINGQGTT